MANKNPKPKLFSLAKKCSTIPSAVDKDRTENGQHRPVCFKSTVYGLVNTLAAFGYLEQSANKKYRLGLKLFELGNVVEGRMDIRREERLRKEFLRGTNSSS